MITKGTKISGRYEIIKSIGEGGMANVYKAKDIILDRFVALKVLRGDLSGDEKFLRRFQREALAASSLSHPNIVEMYDVGEEGDLHYIVMEYIDGETLKQLLKKRGHLAVGEAVDIMGQIARGIKVAHDSYIIHRDLKPQNIMIKENGMIKITDFGIAMALNSTQLTQTNSVMGSVHYLPPEQASGRGATIKSDIYSLGILFYELVTGVLPFKGENAVEIALKQLKEQIPSVKRQNSNIPQSVENIIFKCAAKNPKNRYEDVKELIEDLDKCLNEENLDEEKIVFKYSEVSFDESVKPVVPKIKDVKEKKKRKEIDETNDDNYVSKMRDDFEIDDGKKGKILIITLVSILTILIAVLFIFILPAVKRANADVKLPDVTGMTERAARITLKDAGFTVYEKANEIHSIDVEAGKVIKTDPLPGSIIARKRKIQLYISRGANKTKIDDYIRQNYLDVKVILETRGYKVIINKEKVEQKEVKAGEIIKQQPQAGTNIAKGDTVTLTIPDLLENYPDFVKEAWTLDKVETFSKEYNIKLKVEEVETNAYEEGSIFWQGRKAGDPIVPGITLTIKVAKKQVNIIEEAETGKPQGE